MLLLSEFLSDVHMMSAIIVHDESLRLAGPPWPLNAWKKLLCEHIDQVFTAPVLWEEAQSGLSIAAYGKDTFSCFFVSLDRWTVSSVVVETQHLLEARWRLEYDSSKARVSSHLSE
jgi:hypothetical protein